MVKTRDNNGKFLKGFVHNPRPTGRTATPAELRVKALSYCTNALESLVYWANNKDPKTSQASVMAAKILLDRGMGKVPEEIGSSRATSFTIRFAKPDEVGCGEALTIDNAAKKDE